MEWLETFGKRIVGAWVTTFIAVAFTTGEDWTSLVGTDWLGAVQAATAAAVVTVIIPTISKAADKWKGTTQKEL